MIRVFVCFAQDTHKEKALGQNRSECFFESVLIILQDKGILFRQQDCW